MTTPERATCTRHGVRYQPSPATLNTCPQCVMENEAFVVIDESGPMTPEMWDRLRDKLQDKEKRSIGAIARRLRDVSKEMRSLIGVFESDDGAEDAIFRQWSEELRELADYLLRKEEPTE